MKGLKNILLVAMIFVLFTVPVYGHKMIIEPVEPGMIKVHYADGSFSQDIRLTLYNEAKEEISTGTLDETGSFYYEDGSEVAYIVADDGMGHRVEWRVGDPVKTSSSLGKWIKMALVAIAFLGIAVFFQYRKKAGKAA